MDKDSLLSLLPKAKEDTAAVHLLINLGQQYEANEPDVAKNYYKRAGDLSRKIGYTLGEIKFIANYTYILNMQGLYDSSLYYNLRSVELSRKIRDSAYLAKTLFNTGTSYRVLGKPEKALEYYLEGQRLFGKINEPYNVSVASDLLNVLYCDLHDYKKAVEQGEKAVRISKQLAIDDGRLGLQLANLGMAYDFDKQFDKARKSHAEALAIGRRVNDLNIVGSVLLNLGDIHLHEGDHEKMRAYFEEALDVNKKIASNEGVVTALRGLSMYHQFRGELDKALEYAEQGYHMALTEKLDAERAKMLGQLSNIYFGLKDFEKGYSYAWKQKDLGDSLLNAETRAKIAEMEKVFEVEQKEAKIKTLENEKKVQQLTLQQKTNMNRMLIAGMAALTVIGLLAYRNYRHKQTLQQQRINELETEKRLAATEAVLQGQEQERYRLAKDLHDGLGGMLSGIRFTFSTMKENLVLTPENQLNFERALDMLNSSIQEMRRVAHNLMPESLVKFGLDTAVGDYCQKMNQSGMISINYQSIGMSGLEIRQGTSIVIYRVIQELVNNIIKHAEAKAAIVQLSAHDGKVDLTVEDDGKGFDVSSLDEAKGIGWSNIRSRVEMINGKLDLHSETGKGTSVFIEIPL